MALRRREYSVIRRLLRLSAQSTSPCRWIKTALRCIFAALCAYTLRTISDEEKKLLALAEELQFAHCRRPFLKKFPCQTDALHNLEQEYFHNFFRKGTACPKSVHVVACPSLQEEIRFAAGKKSLRLVRAEGLRFRQIVTNAMEAYEKSLRGILEEYEILLY